MSGPRYCTFGQMDACYKNKVDVGLAGNPQKGHSDRFGYHEGQGQGRFGYL